MQNSIVLEITRNASGSIAVYPSAKESQDAAYGKYHEILARAAVSASPAHAATLLGVDGKELEHQAFFHEAPAPEPEPEGE